MAESGVLSNHQQALLGKKAWIESYQSAGVFDGLMEVITDKNKKIPTEMKPVVIRRDLVQEAGLSQKVCLIGKVTGEGVDEDQTLEGNEQEIYTYNQEVYIRQKRQAVRTQGVQDEQSSPVKLFPQFKPLLADWQRNIRVKEIIRKAAGATTFTFSNTPTAVTGDRDVYGGNATSTGTIGTDDGADLTGIAECVTLAENEYLTGTDGQCVPPIAKINFGGKGLFYLLLMHPDAYDDLWTGSQVQQMLREAGQYQKDNPLIRGGDLHYNGVICRKCQHLREVNTGQFSTWGSGGATAGCINLFLGAGAIAISESNNPKYIPENWDFQNKRAVAIAGIWGVQKALFNGEDFACIAYKTYYAGL